MHLVAVVLQPTTAAIANDYSAHACVLSRGALHRLAFPVLSKKARGVVPPACFLLCKFETVALEKALSSVDCPALCFVVLCFVPYIPGAPLCKRSKKSLETAAVLGYCEPDLVTVESIAQNHFLSSHRGAFSIPLLFIIYRKRYTITSKNLDFFRSIFRGSSCKTGRRRNSPGICHRCRGAPPRSRGLPCGRSPSPRAGWRRPCPRRA